MLREILRRSSKMAGTQSKRTNRCNMAWILALVFWDPPIYPCPRDTHWIPVEYLYPCTQVTCSAGTGVGETPDTRGYTRAVPYMTDGKKNWNASNTRWNGVCCIFSITDMSARCIQKNLGWRKVIKHMPTNKWWHGRSLCRKDNIGSGGKWHSSNIFLLNEYMMQVPM